MSQESEIYSGILTKIFPTPSSPRILDFFLDHRDLDYSISEIAEKSSLSIRTIVRELPKLESVGLISRNRKIGKAVLFRLNTELKAIELLSEFILRISQLPSFHEPQRKQAHQRIMEELSIDNSILAVDNKK